MYTTVIALLTFGLGAYLSALAAGYGGVPAAQMMSNVAGLVALVGAVAVVMEWRGRKEG